jgi:hypothetical protein
MAKNKTYTRVHHNQAGACLSAKRWFLARLIFIPEDGDMFLRIIVSHMDHTSPYPRAERFTITVGGLITCMLQEKSK